MNVDVQARIVDRLRAMSGREADRTLCDMRREHVGDLLRYLGHTVPASGGDLPARVLSALGLHCG